MIEDKSISMTLKELVTLEKEGKLVAYPGKYKPAVWNAKKDEKYIEDFKGPYSPISFIFYLTQDGVYQIIDGKHRISLLLEFGKSLEITELESYDYRPLSIELYQNLSIEDLKDIYFEVQSEPSEKSVLHRYVCRIKENEDSLERLLAHDFFKNCHYLGDGIELADWDCMEILLAFIWCDFTDADKATLPSSLKKFVDMKIPYGKEISDSAFKTLSLMDRVFKGKEYTCRAIDFCCMAYFARLAEKNLDENKEFSESEIQVLFDEYVKMWGELEPCVILNPLAQENLEIISSYLRLVFERVQDGECSILGYREKNSTIVSSGK
jgi:hypothetical protein